MVEDLGDGIVAVQIPLVQIDHAIKESGGKLTFEEAWWKVAQNTKMNEEELARLREAIEEFSSD